MKRKPVTKRKNGRPSKYNPEFNDQVVKLCMLGATDKEMADFFSISEATLNNWKKSEPKFLDSIREGRIVADSKVASSLFKRACGYDLEEDELKVVNAGASMGSEVERHKVTKHYQPDTAAAFIWLKNRRGWRDKSEVVHEGLPEVPAHIEVRMV